MKLKAEIIERIRANRELRNRLMCDLPMSHATLSGLPCKHYPNGFTDIEKISIILTN